MKFCGKISRKKKKNYEEKWQPLIDKYVWKHVYFGIYTLQSFIAMKRVYFFFARISNAYENVLLPVNYTAHSFAIRKILMRSVGAKGIQK